MAESKSNVQLCVHRDAHTKEEENVPPCHHHLLSIRNSPSPSFLSSSTEECEVKEELHVAVLSKKTGGVENAADDEEGYHTPTSPRHRIPQAAECPPAPKKPVSMSSRRKRKAAARNGRPMCLIDICDLELNFCPEIDGIWSMSKKSRKRRQD